MGFTRPPRQHQIQIFDQQPAATETTFNAGVPATGNQREDFSIVLFSPNLQIIASIDNTDSALATNYEVSVSHGFTFSTTQSISITAEVGVSIEVVTARVSTTFALSFTEEWSQTETTTMTFSCPAGQKGFVYQGTLMSRVLHFSGETAQYSWSGSVSKALTQVVKTSSTPIGIAPSSPVSIRPVS